MVVVFSESKNMTLELLSKARELAEKQKTQVTAVIVGKDEASKDYIAYGADQVYVVEGGPKHVKAEEYAQILEHVLTDTKSTTILIGSDKYGKEIAARLAGQLNTGCATDCTNVSWEKESIRVHRVVYSGNAIAVQEFTKPPYVVTIPSKVFDPLKKDDARKGEVVNKTYTLKEASSKILNVKELQTEGVNVEDAEIIVSCGRGLKNKDDIKIISELADVLKGKTVGCSRPIAADLKWMSEDHWIGLSGHKVKPKLYIATGISGQIQHIAGMRDSGVIVAINKDPDALIFKSADYGIVGDLYEVVPKLTTAIKEKMG